MLGLQNDVALHITFWMLLVIGLAVISNVIVLRGKGRSLWLWLLPFVVWIGFWRGCSARSFCEQELELGFKKTHVEVTGEIMRREIREDGSYRLLLKDLSGSSETESFELRYLQVYVGVQDLENQASEMFTIGAQLWVSGTIESFAPARNPGEFDARLYACSQNLHYRMFAEQWERQGIGKSRIREQIACIREWAANTLEQIAAKEDHGIYRAVLLGDSSRMDADLYGLYQDNGVAHLLAVSGLHLSLISGVCYGLLRKAGAGYGSSAVAGSAVLMLYAVLTGESPSVLRALIMGICGFAAAYLGRSYDMMSAWSLALILLLWQYPYRILQAGVQLSFGAVMGIGWLAPKLYRNLMGDKKSKVIHGLLVSLSMQLITLPILLYHYFQYPTYGILLNFLMVPLMGIVVASGAAGVLGSVFSASTARFALGSGHMVLLWYRFCCQTAEMLPGNVIVAGRPSVWKIGIYYGVLFAAAVGNDTRFFVRKCRYLVLTGMICSLFVSMPVRGMQITVLDVGQGDGICIQSGTNVILIDGGSSDQKKLGEYRLVPFFHSQGITALDYAVVSHGDSDHTSGLEYLLETDEVTVKHLILPVLGKGKEDYEKLAELARRKGGNVSWMARGDGWTMPESWWNQAWTAQCLSPDKEMKTEDKNEHSLVLKVNYGAFHMLLTGDMTIKNEQELLQNINHTLLSDVQVLKVAHHGSDTSSSETWLQTINPHWAVISYGEGNRYGHPKPLIVERLKNQQTELLETAKSGAITVNTDGKQIWWKKVFE